MQSLQQAGLGDILDNANSITVFAPINSAFNCAQYEVWAQMLFRNQALMTSVLLHVSHLRGSLCMLVRTSVSWSTGLQAKILWSWRYR